MNFSELLYSRQIAISTKKQKYPNYHIFLPLIQGNSYFNSLEEKMIMYMMYTYTVEGISYSVGGMETLLNDTLEKYNKLKERITHEKGKLLMLSIELPLRAHYSYRKKQYGKAESLLSEAITIYKRIFNGKQSGVIWASLEQSLNKIKIKMSETNLTFLDDAVAVIDEVYNSIPNCISSLSEEMCVLLSTQISIEEKYDSLNDFVDGVLRKMMTGYKDIELFEMNHKFIANLVKTDSYKHLSEVLRPFLERKELDLETFLASVNEDTEIPSILEGYIFSSFPDSVKNDLSVIKYLKKAHSLKLE